MSRASRSPTTITSCYCTVYCIALTFVQIQYTSYATTGNVLHYWSLTVRYYTTNSGDVRCPPLRRKSFFPLKVPLIVLVIIKNIRLNNDIFGPDVVCMAWGRTNCCWVPQQNWQQNNLCNHFVRLKFRSEFFNKIE